MQDDGPGHLHIGRREVPYGGDSGRRHGVAHLLGRLRLRLFGVVQNPFVLTKYTGRDPEQFNGVDNDPYPRPITVTFGLTANF